MPWPLLDRAAQPVVGQGSGLPPGGPLSPLQSEDLQKELIRAWQRLRTAALRGGAAGLTLRGGLHLMSTLLWLLRSSGKGGRTRKSRTLPPSLALLDTLRYGLFLATLGGSYVAVDEGLAMLLGKQRTAQWRAAAAGAVAGHAVLLTGPRTRHYSLATYVLLRGLTLLVRCGNQEPREPAGAGGSSRSKLVRWLLSPTRMGHGDTVLMCLASSQIIYSFIMMPDTLPASYVRFLTKMAAKEPFIWKAVREQALANWAGRPPSPPQHLHGTPWQHCAARTPCEFWHAGHSCATHPLSILPMCYLRSLGVYVPVYLLPALLVHRQKLIQHPTALKLLPKIVLGVARSAAFLTGFVALAFTGACVGFNLVGSSSGPVIAVFTALGGLATLAEKKSRRMELALYVASRAMESSARCLVQWGAVPALLTRTRMDVALFAAGCAAIMHCYSDACGAHRDVFKSKYLNVLDFVFGSSGLQQGSIRHHPSNRDLLITVRQSIRTLSLPAPLDSRPGGRVRNGHRMLGSEAQLSRAGLPGASPLEQDTRTHSGSAAALMHLSAASAPVGPGLEARVHGLLLAAAASHASLSGASGHGGGGDVTERAMPTTAPQGCYGMQDGSADRSRGSTARLQQRMSSQPPSSTAAAAGEPGALPALLPAPAFTSMHVSLLTAAIREASQRAGSALQPVAAPPSALPYQPSPPATSTSWRPHWPQGPGFSSQASLQARSLGSGGEESELDVVPDMGSMSGVMPRPTSRVATDAYGPLLVPVAEEPSQPLQPPLPPLPPPPAMEPPPPGGAQVEGQGSEAALLDTCVRGGQRRASGTGYGMRRVSTVPSVPAMLLSYGSGAAEVAAGLRHHAAGSSDGSRSNGSRSSGSGGGGGTSGHRSVHGRMLPAVSGNGMPAFPGAADSMTADTLLAPGSSSIGAAPQMLSSLPKPAARSQPVFPRAPRQLEGALSATVSEPARVVPRSAMVLRGADAIWGRHPSPPLPPAEIDGHRPETAVEFAPHPANTRAVNIRPVSWQRPGTAPTGASAIGLSASAPPGRHAALLSVAERRFWGEGEMEGASSPCQRVQLLRPLGLDTANPGPPAFSSILNTRFLVTTGAAAHATTHVVHAPATSHRAVEATASPSPALSATPPWPTPDAPRPAVRSVSPCGPLVGGAVKHDRPGTPDAQLPPAAAERGSSTASMSDVSFHAWSYRSQALGSGSGWHAASRTVQGSSEGRASITVSPASAVAEEEEEAEAEAEAATTTAGDHSVSAWQGNSGAVPLAEEAGGFASCEGDDDGSQQAVAGGSGKEEADVMGAGSDVGQPIATDSGAEEVVQPATSEQGIARQHVASSGGGDDPQHAAAGSAGRNHEACPAAGQAGVSSKGKPKHAPRHGGGGKHRKRR